MRDQPTPQSVLALVASDFAGTRRRRPHSGASRGLRFCPGPVHRLAHVCGPSQEAQTEVSTPAPTSDYRWPRLIAEKIYQVPRRAEAGYCLMTVRHGVVVGPREGGYHTTRATSLRRGILVYPDSGDTVKSSGHVDGLLHRLDFAVARGEHTILFNSAFPRDDTRADIVEASGRVTGRPRQPVTPPLAPLLLIVRLFEASTLAGLQTLTGWEQLMNWCGQRVSLRPSSWRTATGSS